MKKRVYFMLDSFWFDCIKEKLYFIQMTIPIYGGVIWNCFDTVTTKSLR